MKKLKLMRRIMIAIAECGPMTSADIANKLGTTHDTVCVAISKGRRTGSDGPALVVASWVRSTGTGGAYKALWALPGRSRVADAKKPEREPKAASSRRWAEKNRARALLADRVRNGVPVWIAVLAPVGSTMRPRAGGIAAGAQA